MFRSAVLSAVLLVATFGTHAQEDASLTKEFAGLSAKERSKLAKQEVVDAEKDVGFQNMMAQAESAFKAGRFDEARQFYADARERRPLNVYPKVKLEDLDALISKRAAEAEVKTVIVEPNMPQAPGTPTPDTAATSAKPSVARIAELEPPPITAAEKVTEQTPATPVKVVHKNPLEEPSTVPLAEGEREYMEGNAKVLEITVPEHKRLVVYKKVKHPWGQIFYFQDGESIGERVWVDHFGAR
ncbi:MAG: hypothetical protein IPI55_13330 [Flavobacteriales bacterium]|nr:hypothetical protein [Flavobacteriales bacterium]